jgi:hypothetical protein
MKEDIDSAIKKLKETGHTVEARIRSDGKMWFEIDREMLASGKEMEELNAGVYSLEELRGNYIARQEEERKKN